MSLDDQLQGRPYEVIPMKVTSGVLLHIGAGIYNSVAGAIKELVSNSFDADATRVVISTDVPHFQRITATDNGRGMTAGYFAKAMRSIGSTLKGISEPNRRSDVLERPIVGHLGIGLMALTQVCDQATIESQAAGADTKFVAKLDFSQFKESREKRIEAAKLDVFRQLAKSYGGIEGMKRHLEGLGPESDEYTELLADLELAVEADKLFAERKHEEPEGEHLGYCVVYANLPAIEGEHGTKITLTSIDAGVRSSLMDEGRSSDAMPTHFRERGMSWCDYRDEVNDWSWEELADRLRRRTSGLAYQSLPQYHQFLWQLSMMTPLEYLEGAPVLLEQELLAWKKHELSRFDFSVLVDNRRLCKPTLLPSGALADQDTLEPEFDYYLTTFDRDARVDQDSLKYAGYLFWQRKQVQPSSVRGVQIYIRNVGIGLYDPTLMGFSSVNPTSRAGQMSGEIYVDEGLERALNVDRNSFRETDAHYIALQEHLWRVVGSATRGDGVMGMSVEAYWRRKERAEGEAQRHHVQRLRHLVNLASHGALTLRFSTRIRPRPYDIAAGTMTVYDRSPSWPRSAAARRLHQEVLVPARAALSVGASGEEVLDLLERTLLQK